MNKHDFPLLKNNPTLIYLDNAASSQKPKIVIDAITNLYSQNYANVHRGNYSLSEAITDRYEMTREKCAQFINSKANEIIFTSGTTASMNMLAYSLGNYFNEKAHLKNKTIFLSVMEHHSNFIPWQQLAKNLGRSIDLIGINSNFALDLDKFYKDIERKKPLIACITHMSNVLGTINPLQEIIAKIRDISSETIVIVDAAQSIAHIPVDVKLLDCDALAFSGHKIFGPTGIGVLFVKEKFLSKLNPSFYGGGMVNKVNILDSTWTNYPNSFEAGTPNIAGVIGLGVAIEYFNSIGHKILYRHEEKLSKYFLKQIKLIDEIQIFGPADITKRGPVFSFSVKGIHPHDLSSLLDKYNIAVRAGHHCAQILHRDILKVPATTRVSFSLYNSISDIDKFIKSIKLIIQLFIKK